MGTIVVNYRPLTPKDVDAVYSLKFASIGKIAGGYWQQDAESNKAHLLCSQASNARMILYEAESCGFFDYRIDDDSLYLKSLFLLPQYQRRGIGRHVMTHVMDIARNHTRRMWLKSYRPNPSARPFYEAMGFIKFDEDSYRDYMEIDFRDCAAPVNM